MAIFHAHATAPDRKPDLARNTPTQENANESESDQVPIKHLVPPPSQANTSLASCEGKLNDTQKGGDNMAKQEYTSKRVASKASRVLSNPKSSKSAKSVAASALTQARDRKKR